jgi:lipoprotein-releasing system permease protein
VWVVLALNAATLIVAVLMMIGPSYLITKINPATSMRYE